MQTPRLGPVASGDRLTVMDMLRGAALLGVFAMNVEWFSRPMQEMGSGIPATATGLDHAVAWAVHVLVAGKFWTMFSLLFGMGFVLMADRIAAAGRSVERVFARRMAALFVFGLLHIALLWPGDILHTAQSLFHDHAPGNHFGLACAWIDRRHSQEGWGATMPPPGTPKYDFKFNSMMDLVRAHQAEAAAK